MKTWQGQMGDNVAIPTTSAKPPALDLTGATRTPDQWQPEWIVRKYFRE
jgi:hypothetical protein